MASPATSYVVPAVVLVAALAGAAWFLGSRKKAPPKAKEAPWKASAKKESNSYYYAHQNKTRKTDGLKPEDYTMNRPRRLDNATKRPIDAFADAGVAANAEEPPMTPKAAASLTSSKATPTPPATPSKPAAHLKPIEKYSWADTDTEVKIYIEPPGWKWAQVSDDVDCELTSPRSFRLTLRYMDEAYGLAMTLLRADVTAVKWKKTSKKLIVTLTKKDSTLAFNRSWASLIANGAVSIDAGPALAEDAD